MSGKRIGFIGLGAMGRGLSGTLVRTGHDVTVWDIAPAAIEAMVAKGAKAGAGVAEIARASDVIFSMVPDAPDVKRVALGEGGIIEGAHPGLIYVDFSTVDPTTSRAVGKALAERGVRMLDCPVGRGVPEAEAGTVTFIVGGESGTLEEVRPLLEAMSSEIMHIGGLGTGSTIKLVNNYLAAGMVATVAEAVTLGIRSGVSLEQIIALSDNTGTSNKILNTVLPRKAFHGDYSLGFASRLAAKDQRLAMQLGRDLSVELPLGKAVLALLEESERNYRDEDFMGSVMRHYEAASGAQIRLASPKET